MEDLIAECEEIFGKTTTSFIVKESNMVVDNRQKEIIARSKR